jgi:hypothetical protein
LIYFRPVDWNHSRHTVSCIQAWYYFTHQNDGWPTKTLVSSLSSRTSHLRLPQLCECKVSAVMIFDTIHQVLISHTGEFLNGIYAPWLEPLSLHLPYHELWKLRYPRKPRLVRFFIAFRLSYMRAYTDELHRSLLVCVPPSFYPAFILIPPSKVEVIFNVSSYCLEKRQVNKKPQGLTAFLVQR